MPREGKRGGDYAPLNTLKPPLNPFFPIKFDLSEPPWRPSNVVLGPIPVPSLKTYVRADFLAWEVVASGGGGWDGER